MRTPTTHILKPPIAGLDGYNENGHFCLNLAHRLDIPTAVSSVMHFGSEIAIVVERYDRLRTPTVIIRLHQENMCQVLDIMPT